MAEPPPVLPLRGGEGQSGGSKEDSLTVSAGWWSVEQPASAGGVLFEDGMSHSGNSEDHGAVGHDSLGTFEDSTWETVYECLECQAKIDGLLLQGVVWLGCEVCGCTEQPLSLVRCPACRSLNSGSADAEDIICEVCGFGESAEEPEIGNNLVLAGIGALLESTPQSSVRFKMLHPLGSAAQSGQVDNNFLQAVFCARGSQQKNDNTFCCPACFLTNGAASDY